ncbi:MAG: hypothetical protein ACWGSQ_14055 [Longimicrobiales bacterium]
MLLRRMVHMGNPRVLAEEMERSPEVPTGSDERFVGYGVMGVPFSSGHVLAFRRMTATSVGGPYTTVWHRSPQGRWTFFTDSEPTQSCPRFFGAALDEVVTGEIELSWEGPFELSLRVPEAGFLWGVRLAPDLKTRGISALGRLLPAPVWRSEVALSLLGTVGGPLLGLGQLALAGSAPNGQHFRAAPKLLWRVEATAAILDRVDLGEMDPLPEQVRIGDFWIPNDGIFAIGSARFDRFDPRLHSRAITRGTGDRAPAMDPGSATQTRREKEGIS